MHRPHTHLLDDHLCVAVEPCDQLRLVLRHAVCQHKVIGVGCRGQHQGQLTPLRDVHRAHVGPDDVWVSRGPAGQQQQLACVSKQHDTLGVAGQGRRLLKRHKAACALLRPASPHPTSRTP